MTYQFNTIHQINENDKNFNEINRADLSIIKSKVSNVFIMFLIETFLSEIEYVCTSSNCSMYIDSDSFFQSQTKYPPINLAKTYISIIIIDLLKFFDLLFKLSEQH